MSLCFSHRQKSGCLKTVLPLYPKFSAECIQHLVDGQKGFFFHRLPVPFQIFGCFFFPRGQKSCRIGRNLHCVTVTFIHGYLFHMTSKDPGQKSSHVPHLFIQCLIFVSQDRHTAGKQLCQDQILDIGVILHLINYQMLDPFVGTFSQKPVFQIQHGRRVLILHQPAFIRDVRQRLPSAAFQKPAVYLIDIFCHIHAVKFLPEIFGLFFRQFSSFQSLVFIYHIFHYSIHARKQRHILKTKIKQMDQFLFGFMKPVPCQIPEIHQAVLQCGKKSFHLSGHPF